MVAGVTMAAVLGPLIGLVVWLVARAGALGRLPRNGTVGIRSAATQASDDAWQAGHAASVRLAFSLLLAYVPLSTTAILLPDHQGVQVTCSIVIAALVVLEAVLVLTVSTRAARATAD